MDPNLNNQRHKQTDGDHFGEEEIGMDFDRSTNKMHNELSSSKVESAEKRDSVASL